MTPPGWLPRRGRPPEGTLNEDAARSALRAFLDQQTERTPPERVTFERCVDAFLERCEEQGRSPNTLRTYRQIAGEVKARWDGLAGRRRRRRRARGLPRRARRARPGRQHAQPAPRRAVGHLQGRPARLPRQRRPDGRLRARRGQGLRRLRGLQRRGGVGARARGRRRRSPHRPARLHAHLEDRPPGDVPSGRSPPRSWPPADEQDLYDAAAILIAALCGLRRSELLGLRWRAVLWDQHAILVRRGFTEVGGDRLPKGQRVHSVPAARRCSTCSGACRPCRATRSPTTACSRAPRARDGRLGALPALPRDADGAPASGALRFHDLRHTFGTQAIASGAHVTTSRSGWATATSRRRCATSTTSRATRPPRASGATSPAPPPSSMQLLGEPGTSSRAARLTRPDDDSGRPE